MLPDDVEVLRKGVAPGTSIRWHAKIAQPVAFGWLRPVVLLPRRVADLPIDAQRAVVCHELLHVARRDWLWMLGEEAIRCLFWFHPAIWFALAKLQLSREELVDEEVVRITGVRQPYVRALAMFAGEPAAFAAAMPFIRRRHLVSRIRQLSEDHTMSRLRIACGFVVLLVVIAASGWAAVSAVPLRADGATVLPLPRAVEQAQVLLPPIDPVPLQRVSRAGGNQDAARSAGAGAYGRGGGKSEKYRLHWPPSSRPQKNGWRAHVGGRSRGSPSSTVTYACCPRVSRSCEGTRRRSRRDLERDGGNGGRSDQRRGGSHAAHDRARRHRPHVLGVAAVEIIRTGGGRRGPPVALRADWSDAALRGTGLIRRTVTRWYSCLSASADEAA